MYNRVNWKSKGENYCEYEISNMSIVTETSVQFGFHLCFVSNVRKRLMQIITDNVYVWRNWINENLSNWVRVNSLTEIWKMKGGIKGMLQERIRKREREREKERDRERNEGRKEGKKKGRKRERKFKRKRNTQPSLISPFVINIPWWS